MAPVVVFAYNRPDKLFRCLENLALCFGAHDAEVIVFIDGPKALTDVDLTMLCSEIAQGFKSNFARLTVKERTSNYGLARSILVGVTSVFERYNKVIVLEDDLLVQPDFLQFMNDALNIFDAHTEVGSISAYGPMIYSGSNDEVYLNKRSSSWGWATWKDRWGRVDWNLSMRPYSSLVMFFNCLMSGQDLFRMIRAYNNGKISSWSIRFTYHHWVNGLYCVYPFYSRLQNIGFSEQGTNTKNDNCHLVQLSRDYKGISEKDKFKFSLINQLLFSLYYSVFFRMYCRIKNYYGK